MTVTAATARETDSEGRSGSGVELRGVVKRYGHHVALQQLDLEIRDGEFFCLLGPSGCGKTTTLNLIGGFVVPTEGTISLRGRRIDQLPPHKRPVNTVFQSYALFPHMTVLQNVSFGLRMDRVPKAEARSAAPGGARARRARGLRRAHAGAALGRPAAARRGRAGARQAPGVLLLDEPLGALDLKLRHRLQVELTQIHREVGTTFVYVTHDQEEAMSMADRIAVMNEGGSSSSARRTRSTAARPRASSPTSSATRTSSTSRSTGTSPSSATALASRARAGGRRARRR